MPGRARARERSMDRGNGWFYRRRRRGARGAEGCAAAAARLCPSPPAPSPLPGSLALRVSFGPPAAAGPHGAAGQDADGAPAGPGPGPVTAPSAPRRDLPRSERAAAAALSLGSAHCGRTKTRRPQSHRALPAPSVRAPRPVLHRRPGPRQARALSPLPFRFAPPTRTGSSRCRYRCQRHRLPP